MLGTLPPEWGSLGGLHGLDLCRTSLTGAGPGLRVAALGLLSAVQCRGAQTFSHVLKHAPAGTLPPEWGLGLRNLTALSLGETALSGTLPTSWAGLGNLSFFLAEATQLWGQVPSRACLQLPRHTTWGPAAAHHLSAPGWHASELLTLDCQLAYPRAGAGLLGRDAEPEGGQPGGQQRAQPPALVLAPEVRGPLGHCRLAGAPVPPCCRPVSCSAPRRSLLDTQSDQHGACAEDREQPGRQDAPQPAPVPGQGA